MLGSEKLGAESRKKERILNMEYRISKIINMKREKYIRQFNNFLNKLSGGVYWALVGFVLFLGVAVLASTFKYKNVQLFSVLSGSMTPRIFTGSLIFVKPTDIYSVGDVISYKNAESGNSAPSITHRIIHIDNDNGTHLYTTKGDRNPSEDSQKVKEDQIIGKVILSLPLIGFASAFAKTKFGFILIIIFPAVMIVLSELNRMKKEIILAVRK